MTTSIDPLPDPQLDALLAEAGWVVTFARRLVRDQAAADDIAQSTLTLALQRRPTVGDGLRPWLAKVAFMVARRARRSEATRHYRELESAPLRAASSAADGEALERFELQQDLARRVGALPEPYRSVLLRRYYQGLTVDEIAASSGATPATVRSQLSRGRARIRSQYEGSQRHGALGTFLIAAGARADLTSPKVATAVLMKSSTKVAVAAFALLSVTVFLVIQGGSVAPGDHGVGPGTAAEMADLASVSDDSSPVVDVAGRIDDRTVVEPGLDRPDAETSSSAEASEGTVTTIRARIVDGGGRPIEGATLSSIFLDGRLRGGVRPAVSDSQGELVLRIPDAGMRLWRTDVFDMTFAASADTHATAFVLKKPILHGDTDLGDIQLAPGGALAGRVVDAAGMPVAGAEILAGATALTRTVGELRLRGPESGVARPRAMSGADGSFVLSGISALLPGDRAASARVWAHASGHLWTITDLTPVPPRGQRDIGTLMLEVVPDDQCIQGTVLRADGTPAPRARIDFTSLDRPHVGHVIADAQGKFVVVPRTSDPMEIVARTSSDKFGFSPTQVVRRGAVVELKLTRSRTMVVTALDSDGEPVLDVNVMPVLAEEDAPLEDGGRLVPGVHWLNTDHAGIARLPIPAQPFRIAARTTGYGSWHEGPFTFESAPDSLILEIPDGVEMTGRVLAYGEPVAGASVFAMHRFEDFASMTGGFPHRYPSGAVSVQTDAEGRFTAPLKPQWTEIGALARRQGYAAGEVTMDVEAGKGVRDVVIHLTDGGAIEGSVTPPPGRTAPGLYVAASRGDGLPISTIVDEQGRYRFEGLTPGHWRVEGRLREARTEMLSISDDLDDMRERWNATVVDRETLELDVDMRALAEVEVQGRLRIGGASPPKGWSVQVLRKRHDLEPGEAVSVQLDETGRFAFTTRPGTAELSLIGPVPSGVTVEIRRPVELEWPSLDWDGNLLPAPLGPSSGSPGSAPNFTVDSATGGKRSLDEVRVLEAR